MKLTTSLLLVLLTSCVGPTLAPAYEGNGGVKKYEIATKAAPVVKAPVALVCPVNHRLTQVDAMAADAVKAEPSLVYRKFSPADSAKLIAYINVAIGKTYVADLVVVLVSGDKEDAVLAGAFRGGCMIAAIRIERGRYDATLKEVLGQDS